MISNALGAIKRFKGFAERCYLEDQKKDRVYFDSVDSEAWSSSTSVTSYSVEKGQDISDHIKVNADSLTLSTTLTNHTTVNLLDIESLNLDVEDKVSERLKKLGEWQKRGELLTYYGAVWEGKDNCVITSLGPSRNSASGEAVELSLALQKVVIAQHKEVAMDMPDSTKETSRKGLAKTNKKTVDMGNASQLI